MSEVRYRETEMRMFLSLTEFAMFDKSQYTKASMLTWKLSKSPEMMKNEIL